MVLAVRAGLLWLTGVVGVQESFMSAWRNKTHGLVSSRPKDCDERKPLFALWPRCGRTQAWREVNIEQATQSVAGKSSPAALTNLSAEVKASIGLVVSESSAKLGVIGALGRSVVARTERVSNDHSVTARRDGYSFDKQETWCLPVHPGREGRLSKPKKSYTEWQEVQDGLILACRPTGPFPYWPGSIDQQPSNKMKSCGNWTAIIANAGGHDLLSPQGNLSACRKIQSETTSYCDVGAYWPTALTNLMGAYGLFCRYAPAGQFWPAPTNLSPVSVPTIAERGCAPICAIRDTAAIAQGALVLIGNTVGNLRRVI